MRSQLPFLADARLKDFLRVDTATPLDDLFHKTLNEPLMGVLSGGQKNFRRSLVKIGISIANHFANRELDTRTAAQASDILDLLHTGSLVVDDVEDESVERRGVPCVHRVHGIPVAINAGNWLYFKSTRIIDDMDVSPKVKHALLRECNNTLLRAHYGQALDIGVELDSLPQERVAQVASAITELKTGELCALAFKIGSLIHDLPAEETGAIDEFGKRFGVALQIFDDLGNLSARKQSKKWAEDIRLKRVTSIMSTAASKLDGAEYEKLMLHIKRRSPEAILRLLERNGVIASTRRRASGVLFRARKRLTSSLALAPEHLRSLDSLSSTLKGAYE